jgi:hypothetical protein
MDELQRLERVQERGDGMRAIDADALKAYIDMQEGRPFIGCTIGEAFKIMTDEQPTIQPEPHWIPVTEGLPEDDTVVLVCGKGGGVYTAIHNNSKTWIRGWWKMNSKNHHCNPIAWMPLPEPYKGVTE